MGEAKRRGSFEERKAQALKAGRKKVPTISISRRTEVLPLGPEAREQRLLDMVASGLLDRAHRRRLGLR